MWVATALALVGSIVAPVQFARAEISGQPSFALPYAKDASWSMNGPHTNTGSGGGKRNSVDFAGGDGKVRAAASGTVKSTSCGVLIDHGGGWHTSYYHLTGITVSANQKVSVGDHIGNIGNAVPCGGYSTAAHVHFAVWKFSGTYSGSDAQAVAIDGLSIGGWTVRNGSGNYQGSWQRNSDGHVKQVRSDGLFSCDCLTNYGGGQPQPPAPTKIAGGAQIKLVGVGQCLDNASSGVANGNKILLWKCNADAANQFWKYDNGALRVHGNYNVCLDAKGSTSSGEGRPVTLFACHGGANQRWTRYPDNTIRSDHDGQCLATAGGATANGSALQLRSCSDPKILKWRMTRCFRLRRSPVVPRSRWLVLTSVSIMRLRVWRMATRFCSGSATLTRLISSGSTTTERCACMATTTCASMRRGVPRLERAAR